MGAITDEIAQAEGMPPNCIVIDIASDLMIVFDRGHLNQIAWNLVRNAWQHCRRQEASIVIAARAGYMGDAVERIATVGRALVSVVDRWRRPGRARACAVAGFVAVAQVIVGAAHSLWRRWV